MSGGADRLAVHVPTGTGALVRLAGGAGSVSVDGIASAGIGGDTTFAPAGWDAADRYELVGTGGVSSLVLDRAAA
jgi:hypothetical protein